MGFRTGDLVGLARGGGVRAGVGLVSGAGVGGIGVGGAIVGNRIVGGALVGGTLVGNGTTGAGLGRFVGAGLGRFDGAGVDLMGVGSTKVGRLVGRAVGLPSSSATFIPETSPSEVTTYNVVLSIDKAKSETTSPSISSAHNCLPLKTSDE